MPISFPSGQQLIISSSIPSNPQDGLAWYELDSNDNLVASWYRRSGNWYSTSQKFSDKVSFSSANIQLYPPVDARYNYLLNNLHICILADAILDNSNYIQLNFYRMSGTSSILVLAGQTFKSLAANNVGNYNFSLNHFFTTGSSSMLNMAVYRIGSNSFNTRFSYILDYQLIRK